MQNYVGVQTPENIHKIEHNVEDVNTHVFCYNNQQACHLLNSIQYVCPSTFFPYLTSFMIFYLSHFSHSSYLPCVYVC